MDKELNRSAEDLEIRAGAMAPPAHRLPLQISRASQIVQNYRWGQMVRRLWKLTRRQFGGRHPIPARAVPIEVTPHEDQAALKSLARVYVDWRGRLPSNLHTDLESGSVYLLGERKELGSPFDWKMERAESVSHLWRFQLHYHEFLLAAAHKNFLGNRQLVWPTIESWTSDHGLGTVCPGDDAWHPYCISRRLPAWIWLWNSIGPPSQAAPILNSMRDQAIYLAKNLEYDPGGNHLLENLFALGLTATFLNDQAAAEWLSLVERVLRAELPRQILDHGEHFERSPMYHCQVAANLLTLATATRALKSRLAEYCLERAESMLAFITSIVHPDGEFPLLGDSVLDECPGVSELQALAAIAGLEWPSPAVSGSFGPYWVQRRGRSALIFDAGSVGPRELPAHSHCDLLGLEASVEGNRWFVDGGNFNYEADSMRRYCRSAIAHNVVVIDDRETCDVWSKFRMGFRGKPIRFEYGQRAGADWALASHDAYRKNHVRKHDRLMVRWGEAWMCGDFSHTQYRPKLVGYLHLAPDLTIESLGARKFVLSDTWTQKKIVFFGVEDVQIVPSWYCPAFGLRVRNQCFVYSQSQGPTIPMGWLLDGVDAESGVELAGRRLFLRLATATFEWSFD